MARRALQAGADDCIEADELEPHALGLRLLDAIARRRTPQADEESEACVAPAPRTMQVLVVEEDPWVQRLLRRNLERRGHQVEVLSTPQTVLAWVQTAEHDLDLLVCDVHPPGMDGHRLSQHLRRRFPDLLTLLVSPSAEPPAPVLDDPAHFAFLSKPYALDDFEAMVDHLVARAHEASAAPA